MTYPEGMCWEELEKFISGLNTSKSSKDRELYDSIIKNPVEITCKTISDIYDQGWRINFSKFLQGACIYRDKKIVLGNNLRGYKRDETLFHELVHLHYPDRLDEGFFKTFGANERGAVVEYFARPLRANPELLRYVIETFGLKPQIYDLPSFLAFSPFTKEELEIQIPFKFERSYFNFLKRCSEHTMMGGF